jgi:hypothetical protein
MIHLMHPVVDSSTAEAGQVEEPEGVVELAEVAEQGRTAKDIP